MRAWFAKNGSPAANLGRALKVGNQRRATIANFLSEELVLVAPVFLGEVHRVVRIANQCFGIVPIQRESLPSVCSSFRDYLLAMFC